MAMIIESIELGLPHSRRLIPTRTQKMAKDTSAAAEKYNLLAAENYGNRLFCSTIHVTSNKSFIYEISHQMKQPLSEGSNDT